MVSADVFREIALALPSVTEEPHFDKTSFRVNKKIFATMPEEGELATVMLSPSDQDIFCTFDRAVIYPVPNKWGSKGATHVVLNLIGIEMLNEVIETAYCKVAPKALAEKVTFGGQ